MTAELRPLADIVAGWPTSAPQDGPELILCEDEHLDELSLTDEERHLVTELRRHLRLGAIARGTSTPLPNAEAVVAALDSGDLRVFWGKWSTFVLDRHRRRVFTSRKGSDTTRTVVWSTGYVPTVEQLPTLPDGGTYLVLWGGAPEVLAIDDVRQRLRNLADAAPVADVIFRRRGRSGSDEASAPATWSLREGIGVRAGQPVAFPDSCNTEEVTLWR